MDRGAYSHREWGHRESDTTGLRAGAARHALRRKGTELKAVSPENI